MTIEQEYISVEQIIAILRKGRIMGRFIIVANLLAVVSLLAY